MRLRILRCSAHLSIVLSVKDYLRKKEFSIIGKKRYENEQKTAHIFLRREMIIQNCTSIFLCLPSHVLKVQQQNLDCYRAKTHQETKQITIRTTICPP